MPNNAHHIQPVDQTGYRSWDSVDSAQGCWSVAIYIPRFSDALKSPPGHYDSGVSCNQPVEILCMVLRQSTRHPLVHGKTGMHRFFFKL